MFYFINIIEMKIKVPMKCNFVTYQSAKVFLNENIHDNEGVMKGVLSHSADENVNWHNNFPGEKFGNVFQKALKPPYTLSERFNI